jgi:hypothetical protein
MQTPLYRQDSTNLWSRVRESEKDLTDAEKAGPQAPARMLKIESARCRLALLRIAEKLCGYLLIHESRLAEMEKRPENEANKQAKAECVFAIEAGIAEFDAAKVKAEAALDAFFAELNRLDLERIAALRAAKAAGWTCTCVHDKSEHMHLQRCSGSCPGSPLHTTASEPVAPASGGAAAGTGAKPG